MRKEFKPILTDLKQYVCIYCGDPWEVREHYRPWDVFHEPWWLPACHRCNAKLGTKIHFTLQDRILFLKEKLLKKHGKALHNIEEIQEGLEGFLLEQVKAEHHKLEAIAARRDWMTAMAASTGSVVLEHLKDDQEMVRALSKLVNALLEDEMLDHRQI